MDDPGGRRRGSDPEVAHIPLPPQLMLRASYSLYLDGVDRLALAPPDWDWCHEPLCPDSDATSKQAKTEPALQLDVDSAAVDVTPTPSPEEVQLQQKKQRRRQAGIVVGVIAGLTLVGLAMVAAVAASL